MTTELLRWTGVALSGIAVAHAAWWLLLALLAVPSPRRRATDTGTESVVVIVPAHNEEHLVRQTIDSLLAAGRCHAGPVTVLVVADNCSDDTAEVARSAGATVIERDEPSHRGKSFALDFAIAWIQREAPPPDLVIFIDADTVVSSNLIASMASRIRGGATVVQAHYRASGGVEPVRRLRRLAFALVHWARPLGASRLGLGTSLKGNGMAYRWSVASQGLSGHGIAEDAAMTLALARRGITVEFEPCASVTGYMPASSTAARVQDQRWDTGRRALFFEALRCGGLTIAHRSPRCIGGIAEVIALPLTLVAVLGFLGVALAAATGGEAAVPAAVVAMLASYVGIGWLAARIVPSDLWGLFHAPPFAARKMADLLGHPFIPTGREWIRTPKAMGDFVLDPRDRSRPDPE